ncbi:hypothetical protein [Pseudomonas oryzihabitans]|uniref:Uncharacterized protein n=1 Tax=Pseudomonas oryzihabitans TaxID=47885 RepID=A0AAJ2EUH8_9PSED|nr:hypothetical protein [Pseudomonas psychrotolerans]MDR6232783.1 hypothetical protein [Pseudomonas psychrotolerans]MDR6358282.1 hypothetical protein [Pseudomonas psychrotolerans]
MSSPLEIGKGITGSVAFISKVAAECENLTKLIKEEISSLLLSAEISMRYRAFGDWHNIHEQDESGWLYTEFGTSLPITIKPKRSISGYFFFQISLAGSGIEALDNEEPLIHFGWWANPLDFDDFKMGFPLYLDPEYTVTLDTERLFRWAIPGSHSSSEWCYSVRLTDINRLEDVKKYLVAPVRALLLNQSADLALSHTAAVRYAAVEEMPGQYRVLPRQETPG